jgi:exopolyphosphatase / guanosine-5'-triphosphate,3'-diphosphate pyrophosphatase
MEREEKGLTRFRGRKKRQREPEENRQSADEKIANADQPAIRGRHEGKPHHASQASGRLAEEDGCNPSDGSGRGTGGGHQRSGKRRRKPDRQTSDAQRLTDAASGAAKAENCRDEPACDASAGEGAAGNRSARFRKRRGKGGPRRNAKPVLRGVRPPVQPKPQAVFDPPPDSKPKPEAPNGAKGVSRFVPKSKRIVGQQGLYAALDLGTNNCRLLVAVPQQRGRFRVVDGFSRIVRLGEGLSHTGELSEQAMDRALEALKLCADKLNAHQIRSSRLIATEACRQAVNGREFLERVHSSTGMELEIIDRQTEAYLAAEGCASLLDRRSDAAVLFDIGGGSSELVLIDRRSGRKRIAEQIVSWASLPVGVVTLAERYGGRDVKGDTFERMIADVISHLGEFPDRDCLEKIWRRGRVHLLGTSGTVTTIAGIHLNLPRYDRRQVDGLWLGSREIDRVISDLLAMDFAERSSSPCVGHERADLVLAGCAILEAIRQTWPSERLRVADRGLREGILTQMMERDAAWLPPKKGRRWPKRARNDSPPGNRGPAQ